MQTGLLDKIMGAVLITRNFQNMFQYADINLTLCIKDLLCTWAFILASSCK